MKIGLTSYEVLGRRTHEVLTLFYNRNMMVVTFVTMIALGIFWPAPGSLVLSCLA